MLFTDQGTPIHHDWMPLAMANGIEWMWQRCGKADQFDNLYRNRISINALLWYVGAFSEWIKHAAHSR